jgi:Peroxidase, family 2
LGPDPQSLGHDTFFQPDQSVPARDLIESLLASASGPVTSEHPKGQITPGDLSRFFSLRLAQSKKNNPVFSISGSERFFATSNASLIYDAVDGDVATLETLLLEERFPENFETACVPRQSTASLFFFIGRNLSKLIVRCIE